MLEPLPFTIASGASESSVITPREEGVLVAVEFDDAPTSTSMGVKACSHGVVFNQVKIKDGASDYSFTTGVGYIPVDYTLLAGIRQLKLTCSAEGADRIGYAIFRRV